MVKSTNVHAEKIVWGREKFILYAECVCFMLKIKQSWLLTFILKSGIELLIETRTARKIFEISKGKKIEFISKKLFDEL